MLILSRKSGQQIRIGKDVVIAVIQIRGDRVSLGVEAPKTIRVLRGELQEFPPPADDLAQQVCGR